MTVDVSLKKLIQTGAHFGHQSKRWNPKMAPFLHSVKDGIHVFDLTKTKRLLDEALAVLTKASAEKKAIVFVGTKKQARRKIREVAEAAGVYFVNERWLGGTLTNFDQIKISVAKLSDMKTKRGNGEYKVLTKKERLLIDREIDRLERFFGGISEITDLPDLIVIVDIKREKGAVAEAKMKGIDTIAMVDSNCDPVDITYPIPMNDDATKAVEYVLELMRDAVLEGKSKSTTSSTGTTGKKAKN